MWKITIIIPQRGTRNRKSHDFRDIPTEREKQTMTILHALLLMTACGADPLGPGDHTRILKVEKRERTYLAHVPNSYDKQTRVPVVLALHGAAMDGSMMVWFSGLNKKADEAGFVVVYPSGTGIGKLLTWNSGGWPEKLTENGPDDVEFLSQVLDDLSSVIQVDEQRVYACGMSNGAMMCYRLAAELSDRIAAIAPVAGTIAVVKDPQTPHRPVPVLHFHGTKDKLVPFTMPQGKTPGFMRFKSVDESIATWVKFDGCDETPVTDTLSRENDDLKVVRQIHKGGRNESEVVLIVIEGGGHTWPGRRPPAGFIGKSAMNISANDLIWEFFQKHKLP